MELKVIDANHTVLEIIERDFKGLYSGELGVSSITGGQSAANRALDQLDISRYAEDRSQVLPGTGTDSKGAPRLICGAGQCPTSMFCKTLRLYTPPGTGASTTWMIFRVKY